jgi:hypothetical protein
VVMPWARIVVRKLNSYTERSPSGTGLRVFFRSTPGQDWGSENGKPKGGRNVRFQDGHVELYRFERYLTVTGAHLEDTPETINFVEPDVIAELLAPAAGNGTEHQPGPNPKPAPEIPDELRDRLNEAMADDPVLWEVWSGQVPEGSDTTRSAFDLKLAGALRRRGGFSLDDFATLACSWRFGKGKDGDPRHWRRTWDKAAPPKQEPAAAAVDVEQLIKQASADPGAPFEAPTLNFLAAMRDQEPAAYERARARLKAAGIRVGALDEEVERRKPVTAAEGKGKSLDLPESEPWAEPVAGGKLIAGLVGQIQRYVVLSDHAALAVALWVLHTHAHEVAFHSARLTLTSPVMRCGKSTLLRLIGRLVPRPLATANITPAAMFRVIEAAKPCLLIDEADSFAQDNEELRGVINSSHCCLDAFVVRAVPAGDDYEARRFSTWAPMAIASIGRVASTIADRSVIIAMQRKAPGQTVARMRVDRDDGFGVLASKNARWVADHLEALRQADPVMPSALNDRAADNWRLLLAIADLAGGQWLATARAAALALSGTDEDTEIGVQVLGDIRTVFDSTKAKAIWTEDLLHHLHAMSEAPWCEYGRARKPITPRQLAALLKPFSIGAGQVGKRDGANVTNKRGYEREQFSPAWERYLSANALTPRESASVSDFVSANSDEPLADENPPNRAETADVSGLADETSPSGGECAFCRETIEPGTPYTATSGGEHLHNGCVDEWCRVPGR